MGHGYAGIDHELYIDPKTGMFLSDAKAGLAEIIASVKALVTSAIRMSFFNFFISSGDCRDVILLATSNTINAAAFPSRSHRSKVPVNEDFRPAYVKPEVSGLRIRALTVSAAEGAVSGADSSWRRAAASAAASGVQAGSDRMVMRSVPA
jgi:hypothetical protein